MPPHRTTSIETPTAHLVGPGTLKVINGRLAFSTGRGAPPLRLDPATLRTLLCYGRVGVTDGAMALLFRHDVQVAWLTPAGQRCWGRLVRSDTPATALRGLQHRAFADGPFKLRIAREWVARKIDSQSAAARYYQRHAPKPPVPAAPASATGPASPSATLSAALARLSAARDQCRSAPTPDAVRGVEGAASVAWFAALGGVLAPPWRFVARVRRPPTDPVNALLSLGYTWLLVRAVARCEAAGLEPNLGTLHDYHPGRPSLACDLIEPLRVPAVDRWVVAACNEHRLSPADFTSSTEYGTRLQPAVFPKVLLWWETHWSDGGFERTLDGQIHWLVNEIRRTFDPMAEAGSTELLPPS